MKKSNPLRAELIQLGDLGSVSQTYQSVPRSEYISTRWYRAPECLLTNGYYGPKMDVWAVGCCFFELLSLQPLFPGENEIDQLHKIHDIVGSPTQHMLHRFKHLSRRMSFPKKPAINLQTLVPNLSSYGIDCLKKMIAYHPDNRLKAIRAIEHLYFTDLRFRMPPNDPNCRLLYTKSDSTTTTKSRNSSREKSINRFKSHSRTDSVKSESLRKLDAVQKQVNKELERKWNMPDGPTKSRILNNMKVSISNQKMSLSCNSSFSSFHCKQNKN